MPDDYTPVDPTLLPSGALASLTPFFGDANAKPVPMPAGGAGLAVGRVLFFGGSLSVAGSLGLSEIFKMSGKYDDRVFVQDTIYGWPIDLIPPSPTAQIQGTFWGSSLRVSVRVSGMDVTADTSLFSIAAAVQLQRAHAQYEIRGLGVGLPTLADALSNLPSIGALDFAAFAQIDQFRMLFSATLKKNPSLLVPLPIAVKLQTGLPPSDAITDTKSIRQAMIGLSSGMTLAARLNSLRPGCVPQVVTDTYRSQGITDPGAAIPQNVRDAAAAWVQGA
jgi:hypothetical protein